jgi:hypothetical protein
MIPELNKLYTLWFTDRSGAGMFNPLVRGLVAACSARSGTQPESNRCDLTRRKD